jgi:hypothetical protein
MGGILREGNGSIAGGVSGQIRGGQIGGIANELEQIACISPFTQRQTQSAFAFAVKNRATPSIRTNLTLASSPSGRFLARIAR